MSSINIGDLVVQQWDLITREKVEAVPTVGSTAPISAKWAVDHVKQYHNEHNDIGIPGTYGFGTGLCPEPLPPGFVELPGTRNILSHEYGNYRYIDGSVMVWRPAFYYRIGHPYNTTYNKYGFNSINIKPVSTFSSHLDAIQQGYVLHRAFINNNKVHLGVMIDKYQCSNNNGIASSIRFKSPLTCSTTNNPFSLVGAVNEFRGAFAAAKTRGFQFHVMSRFEWSSCAMVSLAQAQHTTSSLITAWYDPNGANNFPKGNNNNALSDQNDTTAMWKPSGYLNMGLTGSCGYSGNTNIFAKSTDNGQACGIADLNGNVWEINSGVVTTGDNATDHGDVDNTLYVLKEHANINDLTGEWGSAWGSVEHLETLYSPCPVYYNIAPGVWPRVGNTSMQSFYSATSGERYLRTSAGLPEVNGTSVSGTNLFGNDWAYYLPRANMCIISGGPWNIGIGAGVWSFSTNSYYRGSSDRTGFRTAMYLEN